MRTRTLRNRTIDRSAVTPLVAALSLAGWTITPQLAWATTWPVGKCGDMAGKGGDTLRIAIGKAGSGDTVDLGFLPVTCSTITLTGGQIPIGVANLNIHGSASAPVTIDAGNNSRVFQHTGDGLLNLYGVVVAHGNAFAGGNPYALGGCIKSYGSVLLQYSSVTGCDAATGGGVITAGNLSLIHASISGSSIHYQHGQLQVGAAAVSYGSLLISYSTITGNYSQLYSAGVFATDPITINHSTISGNSANFSTGYLNGYGGTSLFLARCTAIAGQSSLTITASTIDGNVAANHGPQAGALMSAVCSGADITINASTLSRNSGYAVTVPSSGTLRNTTVSGNDGGVLFFASSYLHVFSSTFAYNAVGMRLLPETTCSFWIESTIMADKSIPISFCLDNKLVKNLGNSPAEVGLAPLAWRGGPTQTHALTLHSPAIDAGSNPATQSFDQRGSGYSRFVGSAPDIGAYERQLGDDELFYGGFE